MLDVTLLPAVFSLVRAMVLVIEGVGFALAEGILCGSVLIGRRAPVSATLLSMVLRSIFGIHRDSPHRIWSLFEATRIGSRIV